MTWATIDIAIVILFALQLLAWCLVITFALKLNAGPMGYVRTKINSLSFAIRALVSKATQLATHLQVQLKSLSNRSSLIRRRFSLTSPPNGMWIHPRNLQQGLLLASRLRNPKQLILGPKRSTKRLKWAERLGLVPPLLKRLLPLATVVQAALQGAKHLRR